MPNAEEGTLSITEELAHMREVDTAACPFTSSLIATCINSRSPLGATFFKL